MRRLSKKTTYETRSERKMRLFEITNAAAALHSALHSHDIKVRQRLIRFAVQAIVFFDDRSEWRQLETLSDIAIKSDYFPALVRLSKKFDDSVTAEYIAEFDAAREHKDKNKNVKKCRAGMVKENAVKCFRAAVERAREDITNAGYYRKINTRCSLCW